MFAQFFENHDLCAIQPGLPYPPGDDRAAWEMVPMGRRIVEDATEAALHPYPGLTATAFLGYVRAGDRQVYEAPYFERRHHLIRTAVGECVRWDGTFLDDVIDGLWLIAEETSWVVSAHNVDSHPGGDRPVQRPLPDARNPVIDLFAAQTAATVTLCVHLLAPKLDEVTPMIRRRVKDEVERRVLRPFFERDDYWWMGMIRSDVNNWTPWILSNILICLLYWETDRWRLHEGVCRATQMLDRYMAVMPRDGGCDEGVGYWNMSGASLLDCLELIGHATGGEADFYAQPKVRAIAAFPAAAHIAGPYFWNFADCDAKPTLDGERVWRFGLRVRDRQLMRLGAELMASNQSPWSMDTPQMSRVLDRLFAPVAEPLDEACANARAAPPGRPVILPDLQVWACCRGRFYAAVKGGHNGENHNHNDVGSFLLYVDGEPAVVDAGNMTYTAKTFGGERYTLWNTRSGNHNLPIIGAYEQLAGATHGADAVRMDDDGAEMELARAYPPESGLTRYARHVRLREDGLRVQDTIALNHPATITWVFLLRDEPHAKPGACESGKLRLRFPPALRCEAERHPVTDARMARNFPGSLWRLTLTSEAGLTHDAEFTMEVR